MILRTTYVTAGETTAEDLRFYYNQNWRADVSVVLDDSGIQQERVSYSPYGQAFGHAAGDTDFDGDHDQTDVDAISGWNGNDPFVDVDLDGDVDNADDTAADADTLGWDVLSSDDVNSRYGNAGYTQDRDIRQFYHGRNYAYSNLLGRMVQRAQSAFDAAGTGASVGFFPCYSPCGCEVGGDSTPSECSGGASGGGVVLAPDPETGIPPVLDPRGSCAESIVTRCHQDDRVIRALRLYRRSCGDKPVALRCKSECGDPNTNGYYCCFDNSINICPPRHQGPRSCETLAHEIIHAADDCGGCFRLPWHPCGSWFGYTCDWSACTEIRAYAIAGVCCPGHPERHPWESFNECVARRARGSTSDKCDPEVDRVLCDCLPGSEQELCGGETEYPPSPIEPCGVID